MLTQVEARSLGVTPPSFVSDDVTTDPIQIRNIDGLGPVAATVNTTQYGSIPGETYDGSTTGKRNIVLTVGLNPNWADLSIEDIRMLIYTYFTPGQWVKLIFDSTHRPQVQIEGYVETCEPNIFAKDPEYQISIVCPKPYFVATAKTALSGTTTAISDATTFNINYDGDVAVGYVLDISKQTGDASLTSGEVRVINNTPNVQLFDATGVTIDSSHYFRLSTVEGDKFVRSMPLPAGPASTNIMGKIAPGSIWAPIAKGLNKFQIQTATVGQSWVLSYYALYGGL